MHINSKLNIYLIYIWTIHVDNHKVLKKYEYKYIEFINQIK